MTATRKSRLIAEALGSAMLFATVIGSGIMAERLAGGNVALALLANTVATGAMLAVLIAMFGPVSGAHFNPAVTMVMTMRGDISGASAMAYGVAQLLGGLIGVALVHAMFALPIIETATKVRAGPAQLLSEAIATFGLVLTILGTARCRPAWLPASVALYIVAAYWFMASTSFANPAITVARSLIDSFAGIRPVDVPGFIVAQLLGALLGAWVSRLVFDGEPECCPRPAAKQ